MNTAAIEFREYHSDDTNVELTFAVDENEMNCAKFHDFCKRFAIAAGYMPSTVEKFFGKTRYDEMLD